MRWSVLRKMAWSLTLATLAAGVLVGLNELGFQQSRRALVEIEQAQQVRQVLNKLLQTVLDAETGQRGYLLTGETRYREPYDLAVKEIGGQLQSLRTLYGAQQVDLPRRIKLINHVTRKLAEMEMS